MPALRFERSVSLPLSRNESYLWHTRPGAFRRLLPPWEKVKIKAVPQNLAVGERAVLKIPFGPIASESEFVITESHPEEGFIDQQVKGPFRLWEHQHLFEESAGGSETLNVDSIRLALPPADWIHPLAKGFVREKLSRMFRYRHTTLRNDFERLSRYGSEPRMRILVSGSTGLIGKNLCAYLSTQGHELVHLRRGKKGPFTWDSANGEIEIPTDETIDAVIHLAGSPIAQRWSNKVKKELWESRVKGTKLLVSAVQSLKNRSGGTPVFIGASGLNFYGPNQLKDVVDEGHWKGEDFLSDLCQEWENAAKPLADGGWRVCHLRIGMVLTPAGGALAKLLPAFRAGLGGPIGSGRQPVSWIILDDLIYAFQHCLHEKKCVGPFNAIAPEPLTNRMFVRTLGKVLKRPTFFPLPAGVVKLLFGEMGATLLLRGVAAQPHRLEQTGFRFCYPELTEGLSHILGIRVKTIEPLK